MRFTAPKTELLLGVQAVAKALPSTSTEAILLNILLEADSEGVTLFGTDNRISVRHSLPAKVQGQGSVAIPGALFNELLQSLASTTAEDVTIEVDDRHRMVIDSREAHYELGGHDPSGFPYVPSFEAEVQFDMPVTDLRSIIRQVCIVGGASLTGMSFDEVQFKVTDSVLKLVGTDSVRLTIREWRPEGETIPDLDTRVPIHALTELAKVLPGDGMVHLGLNQDTMQVLFGSTQFRTRLTDKAFPNVEKIVPQSSTTQAEIETRAFSDALKGILPMAREMKQKVHLKFDEGELEILSVSPEVGRARRSIPVVHSGEPLELAFNAKFILDYLNVAGCDRVRFEATSSRHPAKILPAETPSDFLYVLMPINV